MPPIPVTVVSGFLGAGKTTLLKHLVENTQGLKIALIVNDMAEINIDAQLLSAHSHSHSSSTGDEAGELVELTNGCICCTLRMDLVYQLRQLAVGKDWDHIIVENTGIGEPMPVAESFILELPADKTLVDVVKLDTMVTVVDGSVFLKYLHSSDPLSKEFKDIPEEDERSFGQLLADQIECCNVAVLNKADLLSEEEIKTVEGIIHAFNAETKVEVTKYSKVDPKKVLGTNLFDFTKAVLMPSWTKMLREEKVPETELYSISSFVYRRRRPFHPKRIHDIIHGDAFKQLGFLRGKGFSWVATHNTHYGDWSQVGSAVELDGGDAWYCEVPKEQWELKGSQKAISHIESEFDPDPRIKDRRQEIVFIGQKMDQKKVEALLDSALLNDDEWALDLETWVEQFEDPWEEEGWSDDSDGEEEEEEEEEED
eukprot:TRINITY_DN65875_c13_g1_i1.p1 TRINITY_DN65875_c13_g1~~TRINITY_DN65875_c13_g1_i1.p1  ORF type:complete len:437 (-),score=68.10 TRINITY_DN65875_c13_g1_i1:158-1435(-)